MNNWPITEDGIAVTATASSAALAVAAEGRGAAAADVMVDNPGPNDVYVRAGDAAVVASPVTSMRVPPGTMQPFRKGVGVTHLALVCKSGQTQAVVVHVGDGQ
jgi:hypothetical protein